MRIAVLYAAFAAVATAANLLTQDLSLAVYRGPFPLIASLAFGTGAGLVTKYVLDKRYIFQHVSSQLSEEIQTFYLYAMVGLATTSLFWAMELGFHHAFNSKTMRYTGATIGLCIGYALKYRLDKKYVFT